MNDQLFITMLVASRLKAGVFVEDKTTAEGVVTVVSGLICNGEKLCGFENATLGWLSLYQRGIISHSRDEELARRECVLKGCGPCPFNPERAT